MQKLSRYGIIVARLLVTAVFLLSVLDVINSCKNLAMLGDLLFIACIENQPGVARSPIKPEPVLRGTQQAHV